MKRCPECRGVGSIADPERGNAIGPTIVCSMCKGNKSVIDSDEKWLDRVEARWNDFGNISVEDAHDLLVLARRALAAEAELTRLREGEGELIATIIYYPDKQSMEVIREDERVQSEQTKVQTTIAKNLQDRIGVVELGALAGAWQERVEKAEAELANVHTEAASMPEVEPGQQWQMGLSIPPETSDLDGAPVEIIDEDECYHDPFFYEEEK